MDEIIREAFSKAKQDIYSLKRDIDTINQKVIENRNQTISLGEALKIFGKQLEETKPDYLLNNPKPHGFHHQKDDYKKS